MRCCCPDIMQTWSDAAAHAAHTSPGPLFTVNHCPTASDRIQQVFTVFLCVLIEIKKNITKKRILLYIYQNQPYILRPLNNLWATFLDLKTTPWRCYTDERSEYATVAENDLLIAPDPVLSSVWIATGQICPSGHERYRRVLVSKVLR